MESSTFINWHRLFGLTLTDFFTDSEFSVELEKELTVKKQFLDVVIIKKTKGKHLEKLPDGLENLANYNLLTYKSLREPLNEWALAELIGHYVNFRKQISPSLEKLLPVSNFKLYAISTRYPHNLNNKLKIVELKTGVYEILLDINTIQLIVLSRIPKSPENALWQLFSGKADKFVYGNKHYKWHYDKQQSVLNSLYELYKMEKINMSYTWNDFERDYIKNHLHLLSPEERFRDILTEDRLRDIPKNELLKAKKLIEEYLSKQSDSTTK